MSLLWKVVESVCITGVLIFLLKKLLEALFAKSYRVYSEGIILITGASTGIGRHAAEALARKGYTVLAGVRKKGDFESLEGAGISTLLPIYLDVTDDAACKAAIKKVEDMTSALPFVALINNAGVMRTCPLEFHSISDQRYVFETNVFGSMFLIQCALPLLRKSKGRIVNNTSLTGVTGAPPPLQGTYAATKHAFEGYSDALRRELLQFDISVSMIEPAYVESSLQETATIMSEQSTHVDCMDTSRGLTEDEVKALYSKQYNKRNSDEVVRNVRMADTPDVTTCAILDAVTSARPRTRYLVANAMGIPTWILAYSFSFLPDRVTDKVMKPIHL